MFRTIFAILYAIIFLVIGSPLLLIQKMREKRNKEKAVSKAEADTMQDNTNSRKGV